MFYTKKLRVLADALQADLLLTEARETYDTMEDHYEGWLSKLDPDGDLAKQIAKDAASKQKKTVQPPAPHTSPSNSMKDNLENFERVREKEEKMWERLEGKIPAGGWRKWQVKNMMKSKPGISEKDALREIRASRRRRHSAKKDKKLNKLEEDKQLIAEVGLKPTNRLARAVSEHVLARMIRVKARSELIKSKRPKKKGKSGV
jgi:hypothetical protein